MQFRRHKFMRSIDFLGGELERPPYVMATDATDFIAGSRNDGLTKLRSGYLKMTGQLRQSFLSNFTTQSANK